MFSGVASKTISFFASPLNKANCNCIAAASRGNWLGVVINNTALCFFELLANKKDELHSVNIFQE